MSLNVILQAMNAKGKCKVGVWFDDHTDVKAEVYEALEAGIPINTVFRALKHLPVQIDFSDKTFSRHITKACSC